MDRAVGGAGHQLVEDRGQKARELDVTHFTAAHRKAAVPNTAEAAHVAVDGDVVRRVGEDEFRLGVAH